MPIVSVARCAGAAVAVVCVLGGCGGSAAESAAPATATPTPTAAPPAAPSSTPTASPTTTASPTPEADCRRVEAFGAGAADRWVVVDDGVMGGRSQGNAVIVDDALRFAGVIETVGGGFSSVRALVRDEALAGATELRFRARSDGRTYELIADDAVAGRDGRVSHFGRIPLTGTDDWEEVSVPLGDLESRIFGTPVDDAAFDPATAVSIGVILADGTDGPFALTVDWIDACR